ncbi:tRNA-uridine aminocarboxypropyltransferase 1 [Zeugodacus cucurbitae]|uniref:tRNA-uridine aminocarboxypropyltransferase 1 n=1 Tax=Zeugodacus cucurbitae TaxID=28588 RepID=A0A0A1XLN9_ZEUCU|nr:tRNA-uridine aminocarboxypropyltransferase 1 [Zeugodacus cucurbitae]
MTHPVDNVSTPRKYPFAKMRLDDTHQLDAIEGRFTCTQCNRSRKFYCYNCYVPVGNVCDFIPHVEIPIDIDIIKHKKEIDGKSTSAHAAVLAKERVNVYAYPNMPDYSKMDGVILIFPSAKSLTVPQLFNQRVRLKTENNYGLPKGHNIGTMLRWRIDEVKDEPEEGDQQHNFKVYTYDNLPVKRAIFIDSTWNQSRGIYKDERLKGLPTVVLQNRFSQFWRHQRGSPRWYLATVEAVHQFLLEVHVNAWGLNRHYRGLDNLEIGQGFYETARLIDAEATNEARDAPYNGQYDNLLFFFANMYDIIHKYYDHNQLKSYRRPI